MEIIFVTVAFVVAVMAMMGIGLLIKGKPISGTCARGKDCCRSARNQQS